MEQGCASGSETDIIELVYQAVSQVPEGMVSTYGDIAAALGDPVAARAVGEILSHNPTPIVVPCHRIVYSTGEVGWYSGYRKGASRKIELLRAEGVEIAGDKVKDLARIRFKEFHIPAVLDRLREEQDRVHDRVVEEDDFGGLRAVAGLDVAYDGDRAFSAITVHDWKTGEVLEERTGECRIHFPYIPTYLSYREIPALRSVIRREEGVVHLIDGQGVLHPRGAGIASHIGVALDLATVGAAKSLLVGRVLDTEAARSPILLGEKVKGCKLCSGKKAAYVSVGHRVSLRTAADICARLLVNGVPMPLKRAHILANEAKRAAGGGIT
jgi:deoxyribonuclease V